MLTLRAKKAILIFIGRQYRRPVTQPKAAIIRSNIMTTLTVGQYLTSSNNERASADQENAGLLTTATESNTTKLAAKNIRILLKKHFPGVKFSVRMRDYNALYVSWTDGPTKEAVEAITDKFEEGSVNSMEDIYEYNITGFHRVYGGVKYLFCSRDLTDALIAESIELLRKEYGETTIPADVTLEAYKSGALAGRGHDRFTWGLATQIRINAGKVDKSSR